MAFAFITSVTTAGNGAAGSTSAAIDTTGANLIVILVGRYSGGTGFTLSDSKSNTWTPLTAQVTSDGQSQLYYSVTPTVGSGHTFTTNATTNPFAGSVVAAFSGSATTTPFDVQNGTFTNSNVASFASGSITPGQANELVISGIQTNLNTDFNTAAAVGGGFTLAGRQISVASASYAFGMAYLIQTSAAAANPTWTWTTAEPASAVIASFKAAGAAATKLRRNTSLSGLGASGSFFNDPLATRGFEYSRERRIFVPGHTARGELLERVALGRAA